jgi:hypothetical protein
MTMSLIRPSMLTSMPLSGTTRRLTTGLRPNLQSPLLSGTPGAVCRRRAEALVQINRSPRRVAVLEKVARVAVQDRINLLSPSGGCNLSEVIRQWR